MNMGQYQTLFTYSKIMEKGKKHYCVPSPKSMMGLLLKYHQRDISESTYFRDTHFLNEENYITRKERWDIHDPQKPRRKPSIISPTIKGVKYLIQMGVGGLQHVLHQMIMWARKGDNRFPLVPNTETVTVNDYVAELEKIRSRAIKLGYV